MLEEDRGGGEDLKQRMAMAVLFQRGFKKLQWKSYEYAFLYHVQIVRTVM